MIRSKRANRAIEAMHGQFLAGKQITVVYAYKKDTNGERHGSQAERLLAQAGMQNNGGYGGRQLRPHAMFSDGERDRNERVRRDGRRRRRDTGGDAGGDAASTTSRDDDDGWWDARNATTAAAAWDDDGHERGADGDDKSNARRDASAAAAAAAAAVRREHIY